MALARQLASRLPSGAKRRLRRVFRGRANPYFPAIRDVGCVEDIYFWIADGEIDTVIPLENFYSRLFPDLDTATRAEIILYDPSGITLGSFGHDVDHMAAPSLWVSDMLAEMRPRLAGAPATFGNVVWHLALPAPVRRRIADIGESLLFWDRGYIGYAGLDGEVAFVHGVDKTLVVSADGVRLNWPIGEGDSFTASPELPVEFSEYHRLEIIVQNRDSETRMVTATAIDQAGAARNWVAQVAARGVHRFRLDRDDMEPLDLTAPARLRIDGLPTRYGRPIAMKRFARGAFSTMHC